MLPTAKSPVAWSSAAILACCALSMPHPAQAWCRASVDTETTGGCVELKGIDLLSWPRGCTTFVFHQSMFTDLGPLSESEVRAIFDESFLQWQEVDCGYVPFVTQFDPGLATTDAAEFLWDERNESVIVAMTRQQWSAAGQSSEAIAITLLWHDPSSGEIFDVDMALNLGQGPFGDCGDSVCTDGTVDLQNTITHEAGHVMGLGHSDDPDATMTLRAGSGDIFMRDLEADDRKGLCALELLSHDCDDLGVECSCPPAPIVTKRRVLESGCACFVASPASDTPVLGLWAAAFMLIARGSRRRWG